MSSDQLNRFRGNLTVIAECYALLAGQHHDDLADQRVKPATDRRHRPGKGEPLIYGQPTGVMVAADPVAAAMPSGPAKSASRGPVVAGGSSETALPIAVDPIDLIAPARHGSLTPIPSPWPEDQTGHLAVATELDFWVRDIADQCGERLPVPTAPVLAMWLHEWAGWAWDHYAALDEMVVQVDRIARTLYAVTNPDRPEKAEPRTAPCPGCGEATLTAVGGRVTCSMDDCGRVLTEDEYRAWATAEAHRTLNGPEGISAAAIAIRWDRTRGTVKRWASVYGWTKSSGEQRPVLYLTDQVEKTMALILAREERERQEREAKAA